MCGILGVVRPHGRSLDPSELERHTHGLQHRGPDDHGTLYADTKSGKFQLGRESGPGLGPIDLGLGFRRLAIIDLSAAGRQPMLDAQGGHAIVFNGEIYNYLELRRELEHEGCRFRSRSDTEVLLEGWVRWGPAVLEKLIGMFAFAVWDRAARSLHLARDPFGIKPLYFTRSASGFAFASEIPTLLALSDAPRDVHPQRLYDYLRFGTTDHGSETLFRAIEQVPAGHWLDLELSDAASPHTHRYWQPRAAAALGLSFDEAAQRLRSLLLESIELHLRSDVPVGAALSGGIDSSSIVSCMRHLSGDKLEIHSFSYIADDPTLSEEHWVDTAATAARTHSHKVRIKPDELSQEIDCLIELQGEPFGSSSVYAQHRVFRLAQQHGIKVMLDGQGADELLAGYPPFLAARLASLVRAGRWGQALRFLRAPATAAGLRRGEILLRAAGHLLHPSLQQLALSAIGRDLMPTWLQQRWFSERGVRPRTPWQSGQREVLRGRLLQATGETSLPMLLRYEDRNSMAASIESRVPFLTPQLADFVLSLPESFLISADGTTKHVLREAMRGIVPDAILERRDKLGFVTPEQHWLESLRPWVEQTLRSEAARRVPALDLGAVQAHWARVAERRAVFDFQIWRWVNLIRWADRFSVSFGS